jgi:hypothetical protein
MLLKFFARVLNLRCRRLGVTNGKPNAGLLHAFRRFPLLNLSLPSWGMFAYGQGDLRAARNGLAGSATGVAGAIALACTGQAHHPDSGRQWLGHPRRPEERIKP